MIIIKIISIGKTKEVWLEQALGEYTKRLASKAKIEFVLVKDNSQLVQQIEKEKLCICLDPKGKTMSSEEFSDYLEKGGSRLCFVIGGPEGLPANLQGKYPTISLSRLTFTHQLSRLILLEQIYRAFEILKGTPYHKS